MLSSDIYIKMALLEPKNSKAQKDYMIEAGNAVLKECEKHDQLVNAVKNAKPGEVVNIRKPSGK
jgi:hypothetical protein